MISVKLRILARSFKSGSEVTCSDVVQQDSSDEMFMVLCSNTTPANFSSLSTECFTVSKVAISTVITVLRSGTVLLCQHAAFDDPLSVKDFYGLREDLSLP